jgi:hypothetical protein
MTPPKLSKFRNIRIVASNSKPLAIRRLGIMPALGHLMPYEAAAKAIFVRANGEAAYYKATGTTPAANDPRTCRLSAPGVVIHAD